MTWCYLEYSMWTHKHLAYARYLRYLLERACWMMKDCTIYEY